MIPYSIGEAKELARIHHDPYVREMLEWLIGQAERPARRRYLRFGQMATSGVTNAADMQGGLQKLGSQYAGRLRSRGDRGAEQWQQNRSSKRSTRRKKRSSR